MSKDILFDNIIITDEYVVAERWAADTFDKKRQKIAKESVSIKFRLLFLFSEMSLGVFMGQNDESDELQTEIVGALYYLLHLPYGVVHLVLVVMCTRGEN